MKMILVRNIAYLGVGGIKMLTIVSLENVIKTLGRPKRKWEDCIKTDLRKIIGCKHDN
jgi:hypothetical protein